MKEKFGYSKYYRNLQIFADICFINFFYFFVLKHIGFTEQFSGRVILEFNLFWLLCLLIVNPYQVYRYAGYFKFIKKQFYILIAFLTFITIFISYFFGESIFGQIRYIKIIAAFAITFMLWKILLVFILVQYRRLGGNKRKYVVIGSGKMVGDFVKELNQNKSLGYEYLDTIPALKKNSKKEIINLLENSNVLKNTDIAYISLPSIQYAYLNDLVSYLENKHLFVRVLLDYKSTMARKGDLEFVDYIPVLNFISDPLDSFSLSIKKRLFDIVFSLLAILFLSPLYIIAAIITLFSSKGPILYRQTRIGINGERFNIYKFRSMYVDAEKHGPALSKDDDYRITPWGKIMRKYRIDELPQFFNVLSGSMSIVGPRPEREFWKSKIEEATPEFNRLAFVKPGITSLGQVKFGYAENVKEMRKRLKYDLLYLNNLSIWMDIKIIFLTIGVVLNGKGK